VGSAIFPHSNQVLTARAPVRAAARRRSGGSGDADLSAVLSRPSEPRFRAGFFSRGATHRTRPTFLSTDRSGKPAGRNVFEGEAPILMTWASPSDLGVASSSPFPWPVQVQAAALGSPNPAGTHR